MLLQPAAARKRKGKLCCPTAGGATQPLLFFAEPGKATAKRGLPGDAPIKCFLQTYLDHGYAAAASALPGSPARYVIRSTPAKHTGIYKLLAAGWQGLNAERKAVPAAS